MLGDGLMRGNDVAGESGKGRERKSRFCNNKGDGSQKTKLFRTKFVTAGKIIRFFVRKHDKFY